MQSSRIFRNSTVFFIAFTLVFPCMSCMRNTREDGQGRLSEQSIREDISYLSADSLEGRAPGSHGSMIARRYIAGRMQKAGLEPGVDDTSYFQPFDMVKMDMAPGIALGFAAGTQRISPVYFDDYVVFPGRYDEEITVNRAEMVFVGYGIRAEEYGWDDYKDADVSGKIVLIMNNDPDTGDPDFFGGKARLYYGRWDYKYEQAEKMGAAGAIIIHTTESAGYPWEVVQNSWSGSQFELPRENDSGIMYKGWITGDLAYRVSGMAGRDLDELRAMAERTDFQPVPLDVTVDCSFRVTYETIKGSNIIGVIPGSDPVLGKQAVVLTAHYDHLGIGKPVQGDSIYNGALDNASGVASVLALAEAFQAREEAPCRSIVFITTDGEESGLLGALNYSRHPTFAPSDMAADINIDGINIWGKTRDVVLVGYGKSTLDGVVEKYADTQDRTVVPDLTPEQGSFYRSDQFCLAKIGVPALYMESGQDYIGKPEGWGKQVQDKWRETQYHQPSDEYDPAWDLSGYMEDMDLLFRVIGDIADNDEMPAWLPGDEFAKIRQN